MKKILFFVLMFLVVKVNAQITFKKYLDCSSEWRYYIGGANSSGNSYNFFQTKFIDGDTLINGQYFYLVRTIEREKGKSLIVEQAINYLREDSLDNFIGTNINNSFVFSSSDIDTLYKFSLNKTLRINNLLPNLNKPSIYFYPYNSDCVIKRIDNINFDSKNLKALLPIDTQLISLSNVYPYLVEGIGATFPDFCNWGCCDRPIIYLYYYNKNYDTIGFAQSNHFISFDSFPIPQRKKLCNLLPLKLLSFTSKQQQNKVLLNWQTATEENVSHINIQRSINNKKFNTIGNVNAKCCSYMFQDSPPLEELGVGIYYRLEIVDKDGSKTYSSIQKITINTKSSTLRVYPNPSQGNITIEAKDINTIEIIDYLGRKIKQQAIQPQATVLNYQLPKGIYFIKATMKAGAFKTEKIVVE